MRIKGPLVGDPQVRVSRRTLLSGLVMAAAAADRRGEGNPRLGSPGTTPTARAQAKASTQQAQNAVIVEYPAAMYAYPTSITAGPDNALWFTMPDRHSVGRMSLSGAFSEFKLPNGNPTDITLGPDGNLWYTVGIGASGGIVRMTPQGSRIFSGTPGGGTPFGIAVGANDTIWYTSLREPRCGIGRIRLPGMEYTEWDLPILTLPAIPKKIVLGADGAMWFAESSVPAVGRIDDNGALTFYPIPRERYRAYGMTRGLDGNVWYTAGFGTPQCSVGRVNTRGEVTEFLLPPGSAGSGDIAVGPDGNLWTVAVGALNAIVRVSYSGAITTFNIPTAGAYPMGICAGPDGNIWFTEAALNRIGKLLMSTTPVELMRFTAE